MMNDTDYSVLLVLGLLEDDDKKAPNSEGTQEKNINRQMIT